MFFDKYLSIFAILFEKRNSMKTNTKLLMNVLYVISWIIFVGLCIEAGGFVVNAFFALANPGIVDRLWHEVDLANLFRFSHSYFFLMNLMLGIAEIMKAWLFYLIIAILHNKKLDLAQPFRREVRRFISRLSFMALLIGLFSLLARAYARWLSGLGVKMPDGEQLSLASGDVWLFMCVILFVIAQIFKRGIEIQTENELTI